MKNNNKKIIIKLDKVTHFYGKNKVLDKISFNIFEGDFICFFGANGTGKSTLFNIMSKITKQTSGKVLINKEKKFSVVFQDYNESLMPWKTAFENIIFPLENKKNKKNLINKVNKVLSELKIKNFPLNKYPHQMSGGEKQITSIIRALITDPDIIFFDEPFVSLDLKTRAEMNFLIRKLWEKTQKTFIFISHDIGEAIYLSNQIFLLSKKPTKIIKKYKINLDKKRPVYWEIESDINYLKLKKKVSNDFFNNVYNIKYEKK